MLYQQYFTSRGNATDGVKATLLAAPLLLVIAVHWSFAYSYSYDGESYNDLLATDVPEPNSFTLLAISLLALIFAREPCGGRYQAVNLRRYPDNADLAPPRIKGVARTPPPL